MQQVRGWRLWAAVAVVVVALGVVGVLATRGGGDGGDSVGAGAGAGGSTAGEAGEAPALTSYKYALTMEISGRLAGPLVPGEGSLTPLTFAVTGEMVTPDRERSTVKADLGFMKLNMETIQVGDRAWTREDGGAWEPQQGVNTSDGGWEFDPAALLTGGTGLDGRAVARIRNGLRDMQSTRERVNGVDALRYSLNAEALMRVFGDDAQLLPEEAELSSDARLWVTRAGGIPVRFSLEARGRGEPGVLKLELNITDLNSSAIRIEPPV